MRVVGTAGHVDHGKSTLVAALTGTHPDRLKEEKDREMTIELGFAWMNLPDGEEIGIVDVPGHRDFIENMLAGVGGIDAVIFVIAADEGVMPQTREHLSILDILQVQGGVVALTKVDLISDPDWIDLVEADIHSVLKNTILENSPIVRVSAKLGNGLDELKQVLSNCLAKRPLRPDLSRPRLPIDRVFTISGFGTVVTGTLIDGQFHLGDDVEVLPSRVKGRIRGLQTHKKKEEAALPGSRTAINVSGIEVNQVKRGDVLVHPGNYQPTTRLDVQFHLLPDASAALKHSAEVKLFLGASEVQARVRLLGIEEIEAGGEGWLQLELNQPVVAVRGDHYILRRPSPGQTLGGGVVIDPQPPRRHKRYDESVIQRLTSLLLGSPSDVLYHASLAAGPTPIRELATRARLSSDQLETALEDLINSGRLVVLERGQISLQADLLIMAQPQFLTFGQQTKQTVSQFHKTYPLRRGIPREELKSRLKQSSRIYNALIYQMLSAGEILDNNITISLPAHEIRFTPQQQKQIDHLMAQIAQSPYTTPPVKDCQASIGDEIYNALIDNNELIQVSNEVVFGKREYDFMVKMVKEHFVSEDTLSVIQFRDKMKTSRKYTLAFLEYLDNIGLTVRDGDVRRLKKGRANH